MNIQFTHLAKTLLVLPFICLGFFGVAQTSTFNTAGSHTWTCPAGVTSVTVQCTGGGGSGFTANATTAGGGGGAYASSVVAVTPGTTYNIVVGAGSTTTAAGGSSTFNGTTVVAVGGSSASATATPGDGGAAASCTGTTRFSGGNGAAPNGTTNSGSGGGGAGSSGNGGNAVSVPNTAGAGAAADGGNGGLGRTNNGNGIGGLIYGGGGAGCRGNNNTGGRGARGIVRLTFTCPTFVVSAGPNQTLASCATTTTLAGSAVPAGATGLWSVVSGTATITTPTSPTSGVTGLTLGTTATLRWTISNGACGTTFSEMTITTSVGPGCLTYCTSNDINCGSNDVITRVQLGTLDNTSGVACTPTTGYQNFTALAPPTLTIGTSSTITITVGTGTGAHALGVWIDLNQNGSLMDIGEYFQIGVGILPSTVNNGTITIPTTALTGNTRMRVKYLLEACGSLLSAHACNHLTNCGIFGGNSFGEVEDYTVNIQCSLPASLNVVSGRFPANGLALPCGSSTNLTWDAHTCATGFRVYLGTAPGSMALVQNSTSTTYYTGNLLSNTTYYWSIVPYNGGSNGASSNWTFTTATAINTAISQDTSGCSDNGLCLEASGGAFPDYYWYTVPVNGTPVASGANYCPTGLTSPTTFYVSNVLQGAATSINAATTGSIVCGNPDPGSPGGIFFDVVAKSANITVTAFDIHMRSLGTSGATSNRPVKIYYKPTSHQGFETSNTGWTLVYDGLINVAQSFTGLQNIPITSVFIPAGQTYSFYVHYTYMVEAGSNVYSNTDLEVKTGAITCGTGEFSSPVYSDYSFRGRVYYNISCSSPTIPVVATPWLSNAQVKLALATVINAKEQCTEAGWTYYANPAVKNDWLFAIRKNGNTFTADVDIVESPSVYSNINAPGMHGSFLISRYWNARITSGSVVTPVDVRFFFDTAEVRAAFNMRNFERTTNYPTSNDVPWRWFKSVGADFNPAVGIDGNIFTFTNFTPTSVNNINLLGATYTGYINNVPYVEFTGIPSFSGGTGGFGFSTLVGTSLPVKLLDFNAKPENSLVKVSWISETEINNDFYTVERSKDGIEFETVGIIKGAGNSNSKLNYHLNDKKPYSGTSYYRLKQTDYDGNFEYFVPVAVNFKNIFDGVIVYPNPVTGNGFIEFNSMQETEQLISIYDIAGRVVYEKQYAVKLGENKLVLETTNLTKGMYFIRMADGAEGVNIKFIKE